MTKPTGHKKNRVIRFRLTSFHFQVLTLFLAGAACCQADGGWTANGVAVCPTANSQTSQQVISDGAGGAIIAWTDFRQGTANSDIYAQRLDPQGRLLWAPAGAAVCNAADRQDACRIVSDQAHGAILAWLDMRNGVLEIYAQRLGDDGVPRWAGNGIRIAQSPPAAVQVDSLMDLAADGSGGALVAWQDGRALINEVAYVQRVNAGGNLLWTANGKSVAMPDAYHNLPRIIADNSGGAILVAEDNNILAQRIDANGDPLWSGGKILCPYAPSRKQAAADGLGGVVVIWFDNRAGSSNIYGQRVDSAGNTCWAENGLKLTERPGSETLYSQVLGDGAGGAFVAWTDYSLLEFDLWARHFSYSGQPLWPASVPLAQGIGLPRNPQLSLDGTGGLMAVWDDTRAGNIDIYVQRINAAGENLWADNGLALCDRTGNQYLPQVIDDGLGGVTAVWVDERGGPGNLFAQTIRRPLPILSGLVPNGAPQGKVAAGLALQGFMQDDRGRTTTMILSHAGYQNITASSFAVLDAQNARCDLDLSLAPLGDYSVKVIDSLGQTSSAATPVFRVFAPVARGLTWTPISAGNVFTGTQDNVVGQINGQVDGYDQLQTIQIRNLGTAVAGSDISNIWLWYRHDGGTAGNTYDPNVAQRLGVFTAVSGQKVWDLTLSPPREIVDASALYLTADISGGAQVGRTMNFSILDGKARFVSGNTLPAFSLFNVYEQTITLGVSLETALNSPDQVNFTQGQTQVGLGHVQIKNISGASVILNSLKVDMLDGAGRLQAYGGALRRIQLLYQGTEIAGLTAPFSEAPVLTFTSGIRLVSQATADLFIQGDIAEAAALTEFTLALPDGNCVNSAALLAQPPGGRQFPLLTHPLHLRERTLAAVYHVYPNPFSGRGNARVVYYLKSRGQVKIKLFTLAGDLVKILFEGSQDSGLHETLWDGRNSRGQTVRGGAYRVEISLAYEDGSREQRTTRIGVAR